MGGYAKGTRKPKKGPWIRDISIGGFTIKPAVAIVSLLAALYVIFLIGVSIEKGLDALILSVLSFAMFGALAYLVRSGSLAGLRPFTLLIDAFMALSTLSLALEFASYTDIFGPTAGLTIQRSTFFMAVNAAVAALLLMAVLHFEKEGRESIFMKACPLRSVLIGFAIIIICAIIALSAAYLLLHGAEYKLTALNVLAFGAIGGVYEEALFRGLLLARIRQVLPDNYALAIQAIVFSAFEAMAVYALMPNILIVPMVIIAGALLGYYLGVLTLKNESVLAPQLIHAGFYMLLAIPLFMV